jgi:acetate kinase
VSVRVLVVNAGSSSLKLSVVDDGVRGPARTIERWEGRGDVHALQEFIDDASPIDAVGHRVVHGGPRLHSATRLDSEVIAYLTSIEGLAPLHNPRAVAAVEETQRLLPGVPAVAALDTAFHADLPAAASTYALPHEWNRRWGLRRYGFHGLSHAHAVRRAAEISDRPVEESRIVSCHLGAGASLAAVRHGRPVDTTMGFTPLEGLVMATRPGSVDPGLVLWLLQHGGVDAEVLGAAFEHRSGLRGLSGTSGDLRDVIAGSREGDERCRLAFDVFVHRLVREVGAMAAGAGGLDLLVFTGGIGEHSPEVRGAAADGLAHLGVRLDEAANAKGEPDTDISTGKADARTLVVAAAEDLEIARETVTTLRGE